MPEGNMTKTHTGIFAAALLSLFAVPALAGNSKLLDQDKKSPDLRGYDRVEVLEFADASKIKFDKPEDEKAYRAEVAEGGKRFADLIVEKLNAAKGFLTAGRQTAPGKGLKIRGTITVYTISSIAARYIGLGIGGSTFEAIVDVIDAESGKPLGSMNVDLSSSIIPGAANAVQTVGLLMDSGAQMVTDELRIAKRLVHREETGRSGRARDKYKNSH
jgi:Domain of unknown function (DUF4410)